MASDLAYENGLLFNEISSNPNNLRNVDLVIKTLRTRSARLVNEIGPNLPAILSNLELQIQRKSFDDSENTDHNFEEMGFDDIDMDGDDSQNDGGYS